MFEHGVRPDVVDSEIQKQVMLGGKGFFSAERYNDDVQKENMAKYIDMVGRITADGRNPLYTKRAINSLYTEDGSEVNPDLVGMNARMYLDVPMPTGVNIDNAGRVAVTMNDLYKDGKPTAVLKKLIDYGFNPAKLWENKIFAGMDLGAVPVEKSFKMKKFGRYYTPKINKDGKVEFVKQDIKGRGDGYTIASEAFKKNAQQADKLGDIKNSEKRLLAEKVYRTSFSQSAMTFAKAVNGEEDLTKLSNQARVRMIVLGNGLKGAHKSIEGDARAKKAFQKAIGSSN